MNDYKKYGIIFFIKKYEPLMNELIIRDLKIKYRRSILGYLWSLLNPLMMMAVLTFVFSNVFRFDIENYPLYLILGQVLWSFFNESTTMAMYSVLANGALIKKVYIPKFIFPISRVLSAFVTMSFSLIAIVIVMICTQTPFTWYIVLFPIPLFFLLVFCIGISMILSALSVYFRDIMHLYSIVTLAWMYLTPIFYPINIIPDKFVMFIVMNPMYHYITFFRDIVLYGTVPTVDTWIYCVLNSLLALFIGILVFKKLQRNFILHL